MIGYFQNGVFYPYTGSLSGIQVVSGVASACIIPTSSTTTTSGAVGTYYAFYGSGQYIGSYPTLAQAEAAVQATGSLGSFVGTINGPPYGTVYTYTSNSTIVTTTTSVTSTMTCPYGYASVPQQTCLPGPAPQQHGNVVTETIGASAAVLGTIIAAIGIFIRKSPTS